MKISSFLFTVVYSVSFLQHGCEKAANSNQSSAKNQNAAIASASPTLEIPTATPIPNQQSNADNGITANEASISLEDDRKFNSFRERCKHAPVAVNKVRATPLTGAVPLKVSFDGRYAYDPDGTKIVKWEWYFGNGEKGEGKMVTYVYDKPGKYGIGLNVTDSQGQKTSGCSDLGTGIQIIVTEKED